MVVHLSIYVFMSLCRMIYIDLLGTQVLTIHCLEIV